MKKFLAILFIICCASCAEDTPVSEDLKDYLPADPAVFLQMQNPDLFFSNFQNNDFINQNLKHSLSIKIRNRLSVLDFFPLKNEALLALLINSNEEIHFSYISRGNLEPLALDSIKNRQVETFSTSNTRITKYTLEGKTVFSTHIDSLTIMSSSRDLLEKSISGGNMISDDLQTAFKAASPEKTSIFINHKKAPALFQEFLPQIFSELSTWTVVDAEISQTGIKLDGISVVPDTVSNLLNTFKGVGLTSNALATITPAHSRHFSSITYEDYKNISSNLSSYTKDPGSGNSPTFPGLHTGQEAGIIQLEEDKVLAVQTLDPEAAVQYLEREHQEKEAYRDHTIFRYKATDEMARAFDPLLNIAQAQYVSVTDPWILFSNTPDALKEIIDAVQRKMVLSQTQAYQSAAQKLSTEASILAVRNNLAEAGDSKDGFNYEGYPISAVQFIFQENFAHVHGILEKSEPIKTEEPAAQTQSITLDQALNGPPVYFKNHRTKGLDIAVQDVENTLYLISAEGKIHWKKNIGSRILGEIQTVDILRNGRYQLAFNTSNELQVIDRDGNPVKPFPLKFRDQITQGLSIFDYDNNRDYRFVVVQGRALYMYDRKGKGVSGFNFSKTSTDILQPPKHIRISKKDYLVIPESSGKLNILSRTGKIRVPLKEDLDFSENHWYEYKDNFVSTNNSGQIIKISQQGNIKRENLDFAPNAMINATEHILVSLSDNLLTIDGNTATLNYGLYSQPQLFQFNKKTLISVTDLQAKKVYLFDNNAVLLPGFPVYGSSEIDLSNADQDEALELVVQGEPNEVLVYEIN